MKAFGRIKVTFTLLGLGGAMLFTALLVKQGAPEVFAAIGTARWALLVVIAYYFFAPIFFDALGWSLLLPKEHRLSFFTLFGLRWISHAVNFLVPAAAVGGDVVRARLAAQCGQPLPVAAATVLVDFTANLFAVAAYVLLGMALLVGSGARHHFVGPTLLATAIGILAFAGFYFVQRLGMFRLLGLIVARVANGPAWQSLIQGGENLDRVVQSIYARHLCVVAAWVVLFLALVGSAAECWIGLRALGAPTTFVNALILHSMVQAARSAAFLVPGGLGVQEGSYVFVGNLLGIPGEAAFALALIARVRELSVGIPGLIAWQFLESRRLWRARTVQATQ